MASLESQSSSEQSKDIPGFKGLEQLEKVEALRKGAFREFLNRIMAIRQNPEEQKKITEKLQQIDSNRSITKAQKKEQLRSQPAAELLAVIGKDIEFGEKGIHISLDFGKLAFAQKTAIGAGHFLPSNISKVTFGEGSRAIESKRTPGLRGGEYRSATDRYMSSFTGTKIFMRYEDIMPMDNAKLDQAKKIEQGSVRKVRSVTEATQEAQASLRRTTQPTTQETPPELKTHRPIPESQESKEIIVSHRPVFIGDSQVQGLKPSLAKRGIRAFDYVGKSFDGIARRIRNLPENQKEEIRKADTIMLQCGGNNLAPPRFVSLKEMQTAFYELFNTIKSIHPNATIRVGTLMPPGKGSNNKETRFAYNEWLREESAKTGRFLIVDTYKLTEDPSRPGQRIESLFGGINNPHLKMFRYAELSPKLLEAINYQK